MDDLRECLPSNKFADERGQSPPAPANARPARSAATKIALPPRAQFQRIVLTLLKRLLQRDGASVVTP